MQAGKDALKTGHSGQFGILTSQRDRHTLGAVGQGRKQLLVVRLSRLNVDEHAVVSLLDGVDELR